MAFTKITAAERVGKGVTGLANTPGLSTADIQTRFDALANLAIDKFNTHVDELETDLASRPTNTSMNTAIDAKVVAIGSADMQMAVYDPQGKKRDAFAYADAAANAAAATGSAAAAAVKTEMENTITFTLPSDAWVGTAAPYTQTIAVTGVTASMNPVADVVLMDDTSNLARLTAWACVGRIVCGDGTVTVTCYEDKTTVGIYIRLKGLY